MATKGRGRPKAEARPKIEEVQEEAPKKELKSPKKPSKSASPPNSLLASVIASTLDRAKKNKVEMNSAYDFNEAWGVKFFISTGLPDFDFYLVQNRTNVATSGSPFGFPTGRIVEISGKENSFKSWFVHTTCAAVRKMGGLVCQVYTESDFDLAFFKSFYDKRALDFETEVIPYTVLAPAQTVTDVKNSISNFIKSVKEYYDKGGEAIPAVITIDSLGALWSDTNLDRYDKDEDDQTGVHAKDLHKFFKSIKNDLGRYNIMLMFTNHLRDKLGGGYGGSAPAHDSAVKYYASIRVKISADKGKDTVTRFGLKYLKNRPVRISIAKIKGTQIGDGSFIIYALPNIGFDYLSSLVEGLRLTQLLVKKSNGGYEARIPDTTPLGKKVIEELGATTGWSGIESLKKTLKENLKLTVMLEKLAYETGPFILEDDSEMDEIKAVDGVQFGADDGMFDFEEEE